jgi:hypothetical protein
MYVSTYTCTYCTRLLQYAILKKISNIATRVATPVREQERGLHLDVAAPLVSRGSLSHDRRFQDGLDARRAVERRGSGIADKMNFYPSLSVVLLGTFDILGFLG